MEVYHGEANGASARLLIAIEEKGLAVRGHFVRDGNAPADAPSPDMLDAALPLLVVAGQALSGNNWLAEYLEERFPAKPLLPRDPYALWQARSWCKLVDDGFGASVSDLAAATLPGGDGTVATWPEARIEAARDRIAALLVNAERHLQQHPWLTGESYGLADIAVFAFAFYLPRIAPDMIDPARYPRVNLWLAQVSTRPAVVAALARGRAADPYAVPPAGLAYIRWG